MYFWKGQSSNYFSFEMKIFFPAAHLQKINSPASVYYLEGTNAPWSLSFDAIFSLFCAPSVIFFAVRKKKPFWGLDFNEHAVHFTTEDKWKLMLLVRVIESIFKCARVCKVFLVNLETTLTRLLSPKKLHNKPPCWLYFHDACCIICGGVIFLSGFLLNERNCARMYKNKI